MNRRLLLTLGCLLAVPQVNVLGATSASELLIATLQEELGVTRTQATSGVGALLALAQQRLDPEEFTVVENAVPDGGNYLSLATTERVVTTPLESADDFIELLQKQVGISPETATKFGPAVIVFVAQRGDEDAGELLVGALGL
jgi:Protein of unknown function VcgC/VcgE (DUF2780)